MKKEEDRLKISYGIEQDEQLDTIADLTATLKSLDSRLNMKEEEFNGSFDEDDLFFLIFAMSISYEFDTANCDGKNYVSPLIEVLDKKKKEYDIVKNYNFKEFFSKTLLNCDFFQLKYLKKGYNFDFSDLEKEVHKIFKRRLHRKKDNYIHFLLALLANLKLIHKQKQLIDSCYTISDFEKDASFSKEYQDFKHTLDNFLNPDYATFNHNDFEFFKDVSDLIYKLDELRQNLLLKFNINFKKADMLENKFKISVDNLAQLTIVHYAVKNRYGFIQKLSGGLESTQLWLYDLDLHLHKPFSIETALVKFTNKLRKVFPNVVTNYKEKRKFRDLIFSIKQSFKEYFVQANNLVYLKDREDVMRIVFNNGVLEISKKNLNRYKFYKSFNPNKLALLGFNCNFDKKEFEGLISNRIENKFKSFLTWSIKELRNNDDILQENKMSFLAAVLANHFQYDEDYHVMANFLGKKGSGKTALMNMLTNSIVNNNTLRKQHSPFDYELNFFTPEVALTTLFAFNSEQDVRNYSNNSNVKSAIAREFISVNKKYEDIQNVEVHTKFLTFAEVEARIKSDGGFFDRNIYFYFDRKKDLYENELAKYNGDISRVIGSQVLGITATLYEGVQFQIKHVFGRGARIYKALYSKIFDESTEIALENTNPEITKLKIILRKANSFIYKKDLVDLYHFVATSNLTAEVSDLATSTLMSYLRQWSENEASHGNIYYNLKLNNDFQGVKKNRQMILGVKIKEEWFDKLIEYYKKDTVILRRLTEIKNNYMQLYQDVELVKNVYEKFKIEYVELKKESNKEQNNYEYTQAVFDKIDELDNDLFYKDTVKIESKSLGGGVEHGR